MTHSTELYIKKLEDQIEKLQEELAEAQEELAEAQDLSEEAVWKKYIEEKREKADPWRIVERLWTTRCVMCGKNIKPCWMGPDLTEDAHSINACISHAGVVSVSFGYGSIHDTEHYAGNICEKCLPKFLRRMKIPMSGLAGAWGNSGDILCERRKHLKVRPGGVMKDPFYEN